MTDFRKPLVGDLDTLGKRIVHGREAKGLSQPDLARVTLPESGRVATVVSWEKDRSQPDARTVAAIARTLDVSADWLLGLSDEKRPALPGAAERAMEEIQAVLDQYAAGRPVVSGPTRKDEEKVALHQQEKAEARPAAVLKAHPPRKASRPGKGRGVKSTQPHEP